MNHRFCYSMYYSKTNHQSWPFSFSLSFSSPFSPSSLSRNPAHHHMTFLLKKGVGRCLGLEGLFLANQPRGSLRLSRSSLQSPPFGGFLSWNPPWIQNSFAGSIHLLIKSNHFFGPEHCAKSGGQLHRAGHGRHRHLVLQIVLHRPNGDPSGHQLYPPTTTANRSGLLYQWFGW